MKELIRKAFYSFKTARTKPPMKKHKSRGQSLVEMAIALPVVLMLFSGLAEFGFMLNYYLSILDATRYTARFLADKSPWYVDSGGTEHWGTDEMSFYSEGSAQAIAQLAPMDASDNTRKVHLNPSTDDVIIAVYSIDGSTVNTYPTTADGGVFHQYGNIPDASLAFSVTDAQNLAISGAPCQGVVVVEVDYEYHQVLGLPWMAPLGSPILRAYSIFPLQSAEPQTCS